MLTVGQFLPGVMVGVLVSGVLAVVGLVWLRRALTTLKSSASRLAEGAASRKLQLTDAFQLTGLSQQIDAMADRLEDRLRAETEGRTELEAVLSSMSDGVLAIDVDEQVIRLNRAAAELLEVQPEKSLNRSVQEVARNTALLRLVGTALNSDKAVEGDLILQRTDAGGDLEAADRHLQAHATPLRDGVGQRLGVLLVLHDVTRIRRLEKVRRDFVANVSHELKTPVTAIKGFVETLVDMQDQEHDPADTKRFLNIISHQADRLTNLIEDLLSLARIEQDTERDRLMLEIGEISDVIQLAVEACRLQASNKDIQISIQTEDNLLARMHPPLLEQAVVNLIDNAVKYSGEGGTVEVRSMSLASEVVIEVEDCGVGIETRHLPRLFERFYRVDRARSRAMGGTGLGLAIVKHVVNAHGGRVGVSSAPGEGSTFRIQLPKLTESAELSLQAAEVEAAEVEAAKLDQGGDDAAIA